LPYHQIQVSKLKRVKDPSILLTVAAQVHLQTKIHSKIKTLPPLNFSESLNHLIYFFISLSITDSPHHVETEKFYPSLVQSLATRRRLLAAYQVTSRSSLLLLLLSSSSNSSLTLHVQFVSIQIWYF
jgi:hypothetical protein